MKTCWFHLMPYRFLPENFENDYRSVWVDVPQSLYDGRKVHGLYNEYLDELEHAERSGFDGLCVNEHHQNAYGLMPSPNLMAAALTRRTSKAALVVLLQIGSMPKELVFKNTELFGKEVLPYMRDTWKGYEDHWWPSGAGNGDAA
jgi:hypothetical protein